MTWSHKRQLLYGIFFLSVVAIFIGVPFFLFFYKQPTCSDGVKNGKETGIDCGGNCPRLCPADALPPIIHFARGQEVVKGVWNTLAYVENPNVSSGAESIPYVFKLYDDEGVFIAERKGVIDIDSRSRLAIFEAGISVGEREVDRVFFQFPQEVIWKKMTPTAQPYVLTFDPLKTVDTAPQLIIHAKNTSLNVIPKSAVVAILYGEDGNLINFSRTIIDPVPLDATVDAIMSWPKPFLEQVSRIELIPER